MRQQEGAEQGELSLKSPTLVTQSSFACKVRAGEWEKAWGSKTGAAAQATCLTFQKGSGFLSGGREEVVVCVPSPLAAGTVLPSQVILP